MTKIVPIDSLCTTLKKTINPQEYSGQELLHYSIPAFDDGFPTLEYGSEIQSNKLVIDRPCILFSRLNPRIRRVWDLSDLDTAHLPAIASTEFVPFVVRDNKHLHSRYLYWFFHTERFLNFARAGVQAATKSRERVNKDHLFEVEIPLPPLEDQCRIATILDKADAVRRKRQQAIALTEELLRSAFLEMFGDPVTNPKGWEVVELQQVCYRVTDGTHQPPEWATEGIPFLFVSNIVNGEIDFNVSKYINDKSWASLTARCPIEVNDILYTTVGSYGNAALVRTKKQFCFQRHIAHIKPNPDKIHPEFLLGLMQSDGVKKQADRQVRGVAQKTLNLRELKKFQIAVPPRIYQEQYVAFRKKIGSCCNNQQNCFKTQDALFNSLLQRAFRGEL